MWNKIVLQIFSELILIFALWIFKDNIVFYSFKYKLF